MEEEDLFQSSSKKYRKNDQEDECEDMINLDYDSGTKGHRIQLRKFIDDFARLEDIEQKLEELQDSLSSLDPNILIDLTSKLNIGKEIQMEVAEMMQNIEDNNQYLADFQISSSELRRAQEMLNQMQQYKLKMVNESQQLQFLVAIREFFEKLMRQLKLGGSQGSNKNGKTTEQENKQFDDNLKFIQTQIFSENLLGEKLELDQLNGLYVDLLSAIDLAQKLSESNRAIKVKLVRFLEDKFTEAIWINKATDLRNSDTTSVVQITFSKFNDLLRQVPKSNPKASELLSDLETMKEKYQAYFNLFKELESQIDEKKITNTPSEQLKTLQTKISQASAKYKEVPYALKLDLKQKQQFIEKISESINWSINAKGILEERVDNVEKLEQILIEQTQKQLQSSQKLLIKDITERIQAVKKCDTQLAQIREVTQQTNPNGQTDPTKKKFQVQVFIELFDTYKDLNQYIKLESQLNEVEDFLKQYQDEEFALLKLTKNWISRLNESNLDLKEFKSDLEKKSIFEWAKYESNIQGLQLAFQIKQIIQHQEDNQSSASDSSIVVVEEDKKINWKTIMQIKEQINQLEQKDNYVIKNFEGRNTFLQMIENFQSVKMDLDNLSKKNITLERFEEMCKVMNATCFQSQSDKQRLMKIKQLKEKIFNEMREFEVASAKKEKVDIKRIQDVLEFIKQSGLKLEDKKVQLERKILIAGQIIRIIKNSPNFDIDKVMESYDNQSVSIELVEEMIQENKQVNSELEDFAEKILYSYDDYEDLMEISLKLAGVKLHFSRKRPYQLLKQKIFSLLTILIWKNWNEKRPLFGFNYNSFKNILNDSELYDEFIILNKQKIKQLNIFSTEKPEKKKIPKLSNKKPAAAETESQTQKTESALLEQDDLEIPLTNNAEGGKALSDISPDDIQMDLENDKEQNQQEQKQDDEEEKIYLEEDEENKNSENKSIQTPKKVDQKEAMQEEEEEFIEEEDDEQEELISNEKKLKSIQEIIVDERVQVDISILKECRDIMKSMWSDVMKRVRVIRETQKTIEMEKLENEYAYQVGCVDLMDILIEQKIILQGIEDKFQQELLRKRKTEEQQRQMKEDQYQASLQQAQQQMQLQQQKMIKKQIKTNINSGTTITQAVIKSSSTDVFEKTIEGIMKQQSILQFDQKKQKLAKQFITSLVTNPHYKELNTTLIGNTVSFLIKKIVQFQYPSDYVDQMIELYEELKDDYYLAQQYRQESFSFKCFGTMMRLQSHKLVDNIKLKKRKLNEDENELEIQLEKPKANNSEDGQNYQRKDEKKIIDHEEYVNLNYKFSNTQIKDPLFKEFYRLLQSKETLAQFRKFQQDLKKIAGEAQFNGQSGFNANDTEEEDEDDEVQQDRKKSVNLKRSSLYKDSTTRSSVGSKSKSNGQFSSEDEEEYQQEVLLSHPSVLKYIKDASVKKLIDPIKEEEMDSFVEFCNGQLRTKLSTQSGQYRIMYNPLTNDEEIVTKAAAQNKTDLTGYDTDGADDKKQYDPEQVKAQKNIYSIFQGKIHLRPDTNQVPLEVTCFLESTEDLIKECPVYKFGDILKQTGESEMFETKDFLIKSYKCETILSLFGCIESSEEETQKQLDSLAQDLKNRDRVSIAVWNNATKLYIFHKKVFDRDHCGNRIQKKLNLSPSELCFALVFKQTSLKSDEAEGIQKIQNPILYANSPSDFIELQAVKAAQKKDIEEYGDYPVTSCFDSDLKQKFKKPLPKYKKDTLLKIYVPIKSSEEQENKSVETQKSMLSLLVQPRTKEVQRKIDNVVQKQQFQSQFIRQQPIIVTKSPEYNPEMEEFFRRKLAGKRTGKKSIMLDDLKIRMKNPNQINQENEGSRPSIFDNINNQIGDLQTTIKKSLNKKSVTISDKIVEEHYEHFDDGNNNDYGDNGYNDYGGINDYQAEPSHSRVTPFEEEMPVTRQTELSSVSSLHYNKSHSITTNRMSSVSSLGSRFKESNNNKQTLYSEDYLTKANTFKNSRKLQDLMMEQENSSEEEDPRQSLKQKIIDQANRNMQLLSDDSQTPVHSKTSVSSMSENSMAKNRQKLLELNSILDQIKQTTTNNSVQRGKASSSNSISVSQFNNSINKDSELSKVSSLKSRRPYSTVSKNTVQSMSYSDMDNQRYQDEEESASQHSMDQEDEEHNFQQRRYQGGQQKFSHQNSWIRNNIHPNQRNININHQYMESEESEYKSSDISSLPSSDQSNSRFAPSRMINNTCIPKTKLQFNKSSYLDNKENNYQSDYYQSRGNDTDGVSTPQLSLSKDSYSKLSVPSMSSYSGKRSYNTYNNQTKNPPPFNKSSKFSTNSYHSNRSQYLEDSEYDKQTPVLENFVNNTFRNEEQQPPYNLNNNQRNFNFNNNNNQNNFQKQPYNQNSYNPSQNQKRPQPQSSAFIYEQDNYQYNSKIFNKSMQKSTHKNNQSAFNIQNNYYGEDQESEVSASSANSKVKEHQILDLRDQLDSLLNIIKLKKSIHQ